MAGVVCVTDTLVVKLVTVILYTPVVAVLSITSSKNAVADPTAKSAADIAMEVLAPPAEAYVKYNCPGDANPGSWQIPITLFVVAFIGFAVFVGAAVNSVNPAKNLHEVDVVVGIAK